MKARIIHMPKHAGSVEQANQALDSFLAHGWDAQLYEGLTPETNTGYLPVMKSGRLNKFTGRKFETKRACVMNHIHFWDDVVQSGEPQAFIEHDAIAVGPPPTMEWFHVNVLNMDHAFNFGALKGKFGGWKLVSPIQDLVYLPPDYPLTCKVEGSPYFGKEMIPGTAAYAITPNGARKLLDAAHKLGLEQSDYIINTKNVAIQYTNPSPVRFNTKNLQTSHG